MARWAGVFITMMLLGCGRSGGDAPASAQRSQTSSGQGSSEPSSSEQGPSEQAPRATARPEPDAPWLRTLLAFDLTGPATDRRTISLSRELHSPVVCPQPGTGCYVELTLAGVVTQLHLGDDEVIQIWGPTDPAAMPAWVEGVEAELERSALRSVNEHGARPDRLFEDDTHLVLLHDHSNLGCGGFCPAMLWIARHDHPAARGYGFPARD